jgi:nitrite reductase (NADH) large subunit
MIQAARQALVVVGTGLAGAKVVEEVLARAPDAFTIRMFGAEPHGTYNRVLLSRLLGGFQDPAPFWLNPPEWYEGRGVLARHGVKADAIDPRRRVVVGGNGRVEEPYDALVLATGSRPFVPPAEGVNQQGVFVFRTLDDCEAIAAYADHCDQAVVLGGGVLGLEAARALLSHDLQVTVVEAEPHLMPRQLDPVGGELLRSQLEALGVRVLLSRQTTHLLGGGRVTGLRFADGSALETEMVVIACGVRPNVEEARAAGLLVDRAVVVDDQFRTSESSIYALGDCAQHRGKLYGLAEPLHEQARVLADVLTGVAPAAAYRGSRPATCLKVAGIELTTMGEVNDVPAGCEVVTHLDPARGRYRKMVLRDGKLAGAVLLGVTDSGGRLQRMFKDGEPVTPSALELLAQGAGGACLAGSGAAVAELPDDTPVCNCHCVDKGRIVQAIRGGKGSVRGIGEETRAGTGCGSCQPVLAQLLTAHGKKPDGEEVNKIEAMKAAKDGLDALPDLLGYAASGNWREMTEDDKQRFKWLGVFYRKQTPGNFMMRVRMTCGFSDARQFRVLAGLSDQYGKGFCDLTTRQQVQLRWFTIADVPDIWRRLAEVGLHSKQTGMDNVRGVCGCPLSGLSGHELLDASAVAREFTGLLLDNKEFTNLPRKFNVTITGCMENCCHPETQDIGLVPSHRELGDGPAEGFNVLVGGKQGSGGYTVAEPLNVFVRPAEAAAVCAEVVRIFRDHGARDQRTRCRLAFLVQDRGVAWLRGELVRRMGRPLPEAGQDMRKKHHVDHIGIHPQKRPRGQEGPQLYSFGLLVPAGRITTPQMRGVADLAERYGNGEVRLTVQQNLVIPNVPESRICALTEEPLLRELPFDPSPVLRGLVTCVGSDYCHFALIETKGWALRVARELERRTQGRKIAPLSIHWSGCPAGCGLHQVSTIGLQGCRSRVDGAVVDAAHVYINGKSGPTPRVATDAMYDVPCERLADALEPLVTYLPRQ